MIYDYYCTNCGHKIEGRNIAFDLAQILDLRSGDNDNAMKIFIKLTSEDLRELAERNNVQLKNRQRVRLEISLADLLNYIGQNIESYEDREALASLTYDEFAYGTALTNLLASEEEGQTSEVIASSVKKLVDAINARLKLKEKNRIEDNDEDDDNSWEQDTANYVMYFWVEPIFFDGEDEIYTLHYSSEENPSNLIHFEYYNEVRGCCPLCGRPVLAGAGKYKHYLVGFLGAQSAGKTTLFISMINDLLSSPQKMQKLGIRFPKILSDGKHEKVNKALNDNKYGWPVDKTDAKSTAETFNASLEIEANQQKCIITFVDIAGELCYDAVKQGLNLDAVNKFPLITHCDVYMLCTCVSQRGYGEADEESAAIDNSALLKIVSGIYDIHNKDDSIPPLCLVITKVDMAESAIQNGIVNENNPFSNIGVRRGRTSNKENHPYDLNEQVCILRDLYTQCGNPDILESMSWCGYTYENNKEMTYISLLSCSALGMPGKKFNPETDIYETNGAEYRSVRLEVVWDWVLRNLGITPVSDKYRFSYIPSYGEAYRLEGDTAAYSIRTDYKLPEAEKRTDAIYKMYLNPSRLDQKLHIAYMENSRDGILGRFKVAMIENKIKQIVMEYLKDFRI